MDPLEDVEKAYQERLSGMGNVGPNENIPVKETRNQRKSRICCSKPVLFVLVLVLLGAIAASLWFLVFNKQINNQDPAGYGPPSA